MNIDLTEEEIKDTIFSVENGDITAQEGWDSLCLFQKKNRLKHDANRNGGEE